ncbi:putative WRKY transcription factor 29 [Senna tora]|uniref:Putative WRKY transcription factor 29 n=1 Tax=Senna tora TaxID=362788 RepID=A0A834TVI3_9FABA|nr:putative WRKY transcription factor 29 [Senna tora]
MDEVAYLMDWDLQAIVKGCSSSEALIDHPYPNHDDLLFTTTFPEFSETTSVLDELAELYKPFYPLSPPQKTIIPEQVIKASSSEELEVVVQADLQNPAISKSKRSKKNQNKRVVKQVTAEGLCDTWAWRKYGQKPIKGSPYPRSYYRCSSSKGCLARKQVERSHLDPAVFIVTYTAEHSHLHPPRTRRNKYSLSSETTTAQQPADQSSNSSPTSTTFEDQLVSKEKEEHVVEPVTADHSTGLASYDDWIPCIEELNGLGQEFALDAYFMDFDHT